MTNSKENYMVDRIDRKREEPAAKALRLRRNMYLLMQARRSVTSLLADLTSPDEQGAILGHLIDIAAEQRHPLIGRVETATALNSVAADVCAVFRLDRGVKFARAEQLFAANDGDQT